MTILTYSVSMSLNGTLVSPYMIILYGCPDPATLAPIRVAIFLGQFETSLQFFMSKSYVSEYARTVLCGYLTRVMLPYTSLSSSFRLTKKRLTIFSSFTCLSPSDINPDKSNLLRSVNNYRPLPSRYHSFASCITIG